MTKKSYYDKLRDPRWQQKRLEIMQRDGFKCIECDDNTETLNVHHSYYEKDIDPWEYPSFSLHTLCETCHGTIQERMKVLHRAIGMLTFSQMEHLTGYAYGLAVSDPYLNNTPTQSVLKTPEEVDGFVRAIMTNNGPGVHRKFNRAFNNVVDAIRDTKGCIGFEDAFYNCYPELIPQLEPHVASGAVWELDL